ncbi:MAG: transporter substrate-binding domain-containing protein, partial [Candidatus Erginobacter occultus]|nr:transporter substrate-binding domain-containing protein [Candidatus Erginobacter occultus]
MILSGKRRRRDRRRGLVFAILAAFCLPAATAGAEDAITAGSEYDYPPFCVVDSAGQAEGFSVQLFRAALAAMGREVEFRTGYWTDLKRMLAEGELDALPLVGRTPEREPFFDFTFPYLSLHGAIVVRSGELEIRNLDDLKGRSVAVMAGDNTEEFLRREDRGIEIRTAPTFTEALEELSAGRHDAVFIQRLVAIRLLQETGIGNLTILPNLVEEFRQDFAFAVREGDSETLALLNEGLSVVMADGTFQRLHARWFAALELPHRKIIVGGDHNFPPFEFLDGDGLPTGFNVELTWAVAEAVGLDLEIRLGPWAKIRRDLERGEIDAIEGMIYSPERARDFDFTPPYLIIHQVAVVRAGTGKPPAAAEDLAGKRIVVQRGDIMDDYLSERGVKAEITRVDSQEEALRELAAGRHDCALGSRLAALHLIEQSGWKNLETGKTPLLSLDYCFAVPKRKKALLSQLTEGLRAVQESGEYREIRDRWFGIYEEEPLSFGQILRYSAAVLLPLLAILAAILFWSWSLRREVKRRTAELADSERRYRTLFERAPVGIFTTSSTGEPISVNPALAGIFGFSSPEMAVAHYRELGQDLYFSAERRDKFLRELEETGLVTDFEYRGRRADGEPVWLSMNARVAETQPDGSFIIEGFTIDITERKQGEAERERLVAAIEQSAEAIVITDPDGIIRYANPAFETVTGYSRKEALGRTPRILKSGEQ